MSLEQFRELCNKGDHYWFKSLQDFDKRIDWNWTDVSSLSFTRWVEDTGEYNIMSNANPTKRMAYWFKK